METNGHTFHERRGKVRGQSDDFVEKDQFKRQKSERTILAEQVGEVHLAEKGNVTEDEGQTNGNHEGEGTTNKELAEDEIDAPSLRNVVEDVLDFMTGGRLSPQIGFEPDKSIKEQFENNIAIQHPKYEMATGVRLGVNLRKHENGGFLVRNVLEGGLLAGKNIRPEDLITHVNETDVRNMSLAGLQRFFWDLNFETRFSLTILRETEDEGETVRYDTLVVDVTVSIEDEVIKVTTEIERAPLYTWQSLQEDSFLISVVVDGNQKYFSAQSDMTLKVIDLQSPEDPNSLWKQQLCTQFDSPPYRLLYNVGTQMTICCNIASDSSIVKMSSRSILQKGSHPDQADFDRLFIGNYVTEGKEHFYLQSVSHPDHYMCLSSDPDHESCLEMATESEHPKTVFQFSQFRKTTVQK